MSLDDLNIKHDVWRKVVAVIILAIVLLFVFIFWPTILDLVTGDYRDSPSEQLHGSIPIFSLFLNLLKILSFT